MAWHLFGGKKKDEHLDYTIGGQNVALDLHHIKGTRSLRTEDHAQCRITLPSESAMENTPYVFLLKECKTRLQQAVGHEILYDQPNRVLSDAFAATDQDAKIPAVKATLEAIVSDYPTLPALKKAAMVDIARDDTESARLELMTTTLRR